MSQPVRSHGGGARPLRLAPFRALRYNPAAVNDLGAVTCPPYDVIGADRVERWEAAEPHNVVRLILPRPGDGDDRYTHAARELRSWIAHGVLVRDAAASLYVYEHAGNGTALGLVGAVSLHEPGERRILPHEDVFPGVVEDRAALMAATAAQLEPILLTYDGGGPASDVVDEAVTGKPTLRADTPDGAVHRIWRVSDPAALDQIAADLAHRRALIADGHHRYAAYLRLRERALGSGAQAGLAMLVDAQRHPLRIGAIHRSVAGMPWRSAVQAVRRVFGSVHMLRVQDAADVLSRLAAARSRGGLAFAIGAGLDVALVTDPDPSAVAAHMPRERSALWRSLDASVARQLVLVHAWGMSDTDDRVAFHHDAADALATAAASGGVALLLNPPRHDDVLAIAAQGERMPRKSTSFGPKPWTGLLMRLLDG